MEERIAVLEINELPGSESRMDAAFFLGSSTGTDEADRELVRDVVSAGRVRRGKAGRRRAAPGAIVSTPFELQLMRQSRSENQLHTYGAFCQAGCHCEMRGDVVELLALVDGLKN